MDLAPWPPAKARGPAVTPRSVARASAPWRSQGCDRRDCAEQAKELEALRTVVWDLDRQLRRSDDDRPRLVQEHAEAVRLLRQEEALRAELERELVEWQIQ